jgi:hypothetical protein
MPLFDEIDTKQRLQILRGTYKSLEIELFEVLTRLGIDVDEYVPGEHPDFADSVENWNKRRVIELEVTLATIKAKIDSLAV